MKSLDLHNIKHEHANIIVEDFILRNDPPYNIITGNSLQMHSIVVTFVKKYNLDICYLNSNNIGCMTIIDKISIK